MPADSTGTGDNTVAGQALLVHIEIVGCMLNEDIVFMKRSRVEQGNDTLPRCKLAYRLLLFYCFGSTSLESIAHSLFQVGGFSL